MSTTETKETADMAALYGRLQGQAGEATRIGSKRSGIGARLETWEGSIGVTLDADGTFTVRIGDKHTPQHVIATGNVNAAVVAYPGHYAVTAGSDAPLLPIATDEPERPVIGELTYRLEDGLWNEDAEGVLDVYSVGGRDWMGKTEYVTEAGTLYLFPHEVVEYTAVGE